MEPAKIALGGNMLITIHITIIIIIVPRAHLSLRVEKQGDWYSLGSKMEVNSRFYTIPDGTLQKLLNVNRLSSNGWKYSTNLDYGLTNIYSYHISG